MIDLAAHWFYGERQLSASATVERMRHALRPLGFLKTLKVWLCAGCGARKHSRLNLSRATS
jgi:hypothetical protein